MRPRDGAAQGSGFRHGKSWRMVDYLDGNVERRQKSQELWFGLHQGVPLSEVGGFLDGSASLHKLGPTGCG